MFLCHRLQSYSSSSPPDYDWLKQIFEGSKHETAYYLDHTSGSGTLPRDQLLPVFVAFCEHHGTRWKT